jgi:hypothetical protein
MQVFVLRLNESFLRAFNFTKWWVGGSSSVIFTILLTFLFEMEIYEFQHVHLKWSRRGIYVYSIKVSRDSGSHLFNFSSKIILFIAANSHVIA